MTDAQTPPSPEQPEKGLVPMFGWPTVWMLLIIMSSIVLVFIIGLFILVLYAVDVKSFNSVAIVAIISPVLTAIGTIAAGVFGYSLGSEGSAAAQKTASQAQEVANTVTQEAAVAKQEAATKIDAAVPLVRTVERILNQQALVEGEATQSGKYEISLDDLKTIIEEGREVSKKLGI
jgi:hypothetical protein